MLLRADASPFAGYDVYRIRSFWDIGTNDHTGQLYGHILLILFNFRQKISKVNLDIKMIHCLARDLPQTLSQGPVQQSPTTFDRIDCSNLMDTSSMGMETVSKKFGPLLKSRDENPHSCLVVLMRDAVLEAEEHLRKTGEQDRPLSNSRIDFLVKAIPKEYLTERMQLTIRPLIKALLPLIRDNLFYLDQYLRIFDTKETVARAGFRLREQNRVISCLPYNHHTSVGGLMHILWSAHIAHGAYLEIERDEMPPNQDPASQLPKIATPRTEATAKKDSKVKAMVPRLVCHQTSVLFNR